MKLSAKRNNNILNSIIMNKTLVCPDGRSTDTEVFFLPLLLQMSKILGTPVKTRLKTSAETRLKTRLKPSASASLDTRLKASTKPSTPVPPNRSSEV